MNVSKRKRKRWDFNERTNLLVSKFSKMEVTIQQGGDVGQYVVNRCHKVAMGFVFSFWLPEYPHVGHE
jgi:hypothetical protein